MCGSEHVPKSGNWKGGVPLEVQEALKQQLSLSSSGGDKNDPSGEEAGAGAGAEAEILAQAEVLRFPISMGPLRRDLDKNDLPCYVVDCVFNRDVVQVGGCAMGGRRKGGEEGGRRRGEKKGEMEERSRRRSRRRRRRRSVVDICKCI